MTVPPVLPADGVDVHAHVLDPTRPAAPGARYAPTAGRGIAEYAAHLDALGLRRGVLVTATAHGVDNAPLLDAIAAAPDDRRGVAVVEPGVGDAELDRLVAGGVRAVRVQDLYPGGTPLAALSTLGPRLAARGGHAEVWTDVAAHLAWLPQAVAEAGCPVVLDHLGFADPTDTCVDDALVELARAGHAWITVSGAFRHLPALPVTVARSVLTPRVRRLVDAVPERLLWGSDWPYVGIDGETPTPEGLVAEVLAWFPDADLRRRVLVENPEECYGFAPAARRGTAGGQLPR